VLMVIVMIVAFMFFMPLVLVMGRGIFHTMIMMRMFIVILVMSVIVRYRVIIMRMMMLLIPVM